MKKKIIIIAGVLIIAAIGFYVFKPAAPQIERQAKLEARDINLAFRLTGEVNPRNRLEIKPQFSGRIESILVSEGDTVKKGQTVILMSSSERAAMLDAARAMGEKEYKRWKTIYKESPIVAPMNGFVILRSKEPGQTVTASDVVLVMADDLVIDANVDETDLKYMRIGQELIMSLDAFPDEKFGGIVEHIAYEATVVSNVTVYTVRIRPINKPKIFRSGMTATITVEIENKTGVLALPVEFINTVGDRNSVMVVADKPRRKNMGNFEVRQVELGLSDGRWTEIVSGLGEDDVVVILGTAKAKNAKSGGGMMGGQRVGR